ncbi:TPA: hypothetical protein N0F65_001187 [Lagenidium giganteum]|uniref:Uncharacterized protein n=1 Tax=Lagenidium giganteum TaxID=4803 RepID=A0AAV2Z082_9STRA|nr:TPA: hypothetical protein N0F65_001187 [Lagenidium giganteum]
MGSLRGSRGSSVGTPLLIVVCAFVVLALALALRQQLRRRQTKYHPPIDLESREVLSNISRRKEDLQLFIGRLQAKLAARQRQLRYHDELEQIVTGRIETSRRSDPEWESLMERGRQLHGDKWDESPDGTQPSLRELMELHKDELLEYKRSVDSAAVKDKKPRTSRIMQLSPPQTIPILSSKGTTADPQAEAIPTISKGVPQWQSTRRMAESLASPRRTSRSDPITQTASDEKSKPIRAASAAPISIPKLDFSKITRTTAIHQHPLLSSSSAKTKELASHRESRLKQFLRKN